MGGGREGREEERSEVKQGPPQVSTNRHAMFVKVSLVIHRLYCLDMRTLTLHIWTGRLFMPPSHTSADLPNSLHLVCKNPFLDHLTCIRE